MTVAIEQRVDQIKQAFARFAADSRHRFSQEDVPAAVLTQLSATEGFPRDLWLLLREVGEMFSWGYNGCQMIDWWVPCTLGFAAAEARCVYDVRESNFENGADLLLFAWDCDARVYFYDTAQKPWRVVSTDGLSFSFLNEDADRAGTQEAVTGYRCDDESRNAVEIIENWVNSVLSSGGK
jgi:hypothetical protein